MDVNDLIARHPCLFHMAEAGAWPTILQHGLLSTSALLDLFEVHGRERRAIESARRPKVVEISHPVHGKALIRDNKPLREQFLIECLKGMSLAEWYKLLNRQVFFWVRPERLNTLLAARAYRNRPHDVLTIDTAALLAQCFDRTRLAAINTGATLYPSAPERGPRTFVPIDEYDWHAMRKRRGTQNAIVELAVEYAVPDIAAVALRVERRQAGQDTELLWQAE